jgi:NAD dependent epimerase/dehydratase family enzyme
METVLITGGTGLIGKTLTHQLIKKNYRVIILTRKLPSTQQTHANISYALWNIEEKKIDTQAIQKADHIIHLAGAGVVDKRWTRAYKKEILDSRIQSSALLIQALQQNNNKIKKHCECFCYWMVWCR